MVLLNSVHIYAFSQPPEKLHVFETYDNPHGLVAMSATTLAFPGRKPGYLHMFDLATGNVTIIPAHTTPLAAIAISPNGDIIATASERVTYPVVPALRHRILTLAPCIGYISSSLLN